MYHTLKFLATLIYVLTALSPAVVLLYRKVRWTWLRRQHIRRRAATERAGVEHWKSVN